MAPLRRYLRITPTSVLEVRIYLDNPADTYRWLLNEKKPMLGRVVEAVRPLVLPKLREENENSRVGKGGVVKKGKGKRRGVKDVVGTDDFEVSIFLTELSTRHSILTRRKVFKSEKERLGNTRGKMVGETRDRPVEIEGEAEEDGRGVVAGVVVREEEIEEEGKEGLRLRDIPAAADDDREAGPGGEADGKGSTRKRRRDPTDDEDDEEGEEEEEGLFLSDDSASSDAHFQTQKSPPSKRKKNAAPTITTGTTDDGDDEKKKMAVNTTYDGYAIYGRILCLIVKRRGVVRGKEVQGGTGQAVMEEWVRSTQVGGGEEGE